MFNQALATRSKELFFSISYNFYQKILKKYDVNAHKKSFSTRISFKIFFYLCAKFKKLHFSKVIVFTYFDTVKYRAVEKNDFLQRKRGLAKRLKKF